MLYFLNVVYCGWCGFYVVLFGIHHGTNMASDWLVSVAMALCLTLLVSQPFGMFMKSAVLPAVATKMVAGTEVRVGGGGHHLDSLLVLCVLI